MTKNSVGWRIAKNVRIGFKLPFTATLEFHSHHNWCYQSMLLFSGAPEDPENETVMDKHSADALYSAVKCLTDAINTEDKDAQHNMAHRIIQIGKLWTLSRWSESKLPHVKPLARITKDNAHRVGLKWTADWQAQLKSLVKR
jgi:predicted  nucleic acid-binding Zn ribbon protein